MRRLCAAIVALTALLPLAAGAEEPFVATFRLDPFSVVSFGDQEIYPLPEGSEIQFEFAPSGAPGSRGFSIRPSEALIKPMPLRGVGESMQFTLARTATGVMRRAPEGGLVIEIDAYVTVTLDHPDTPGWKRLPIRLTTESAQARSRDGRQVIDVAGGRVAGRGVQLVGATTNSDADHPKPGAAVYVVLSGVFDRLPSLD
jgi:hypothetical protein